MTARERQITLTFNPKQLTVGDDADVRQQVSAVALDGDHLWVACDEGCRLDRLTQTGDDAFARHKVFPLDDLVKLAADDTEEADIEGMYVDDGWLWVIGSHAVKRKSAKDERPKEVARLLGKTARDGNRHLLARMPLAGGAVTKKDGKRRAATLPATAASSDLLDAVRKDDHLAPFVDIPGKDNGFDIEGLAVRGRRLWAGLRGPVLREWCCILELHVDADGGRLSLEKRGGARIRKHFLKLDGLGVRDLVILDDDLLILAGPTMGLDAPCSVWRWKGGAKEGAAVDMSAVTQVLQVPLTRQYDKPEGLAVLPQKGGATELLVAFDSPAAARLTRPASVSADVYRLA